MTSSDAKLMRAIGQELVGRIEPELQTADARERVAFMKTALDYFASEQDVLPPLAVEAIPRLRNALAEAIAMLPAKLASAGYRQALANIVRQEGSASALEIAQLRALSARLVRALADLPASEMTDEERENVVRCRASLAQADRSWLAAFDEARQRKAQNGSAADAPDAARAETVTPHSLTHYLRRQFPTSGEITVTSVLPIPGGRSKRTILVTLRHGGQLPEELVMRQDMYLQQTGTTVRDEYQPLKLLSELDLPVPKPVHFEGEPSELGPPFLLVERLAGAVPGSYFGMDAACPRAFADLARLLGRLHGIEPAAAGVQRTAAEGPYGRMGDQVEEYWRLWRKNSIWPSPVVESAYAWARDEYAATKGATALVHGDCGPHNLLVQDGRLTALLDWEFLHIGDPAEDLGIARVYAETMMPWAEFADIYKQAGGLDVPERRIRLAMLLHYLKGTILVAASGRNFAEGVTDDFIKGANSYTGMRRIEMKITEFFDRLA